MAGKRWTSHKTILAALALAVMVPGSGLAAPEAQDDSVPTMLELQGDLMSYADRFASVMIQSFQQYDDSDPASEARHFILTDLSYSIASVFTVAAELNPQSALLDMIVVTSLGRMIYEDTLSVRYPGLEPVLTGFRTQEGELWSIAGRVLSPEESREVRSLIQQWRTENPEVVVYNYIRFTDFGSLRRQSTMVRQRGGGLFGSVKAVTQEAEEARMLAERAMFIFTRLPLLTGNFAEVWTSQVLKNPDTQKVLSDLHTISTLLERVMVVAEGLPDTIAEKQLVIIDDVMERVVSLRDDTVEQVIEQVRLEREAAIRQLLDGLAEERANTILDLSGEEKRLTGLVAELRSAIQGGSELMAATQQLSDSLNLAEAEFDFDLYRDTFTEVAVAAGELRELVESSESVLANGKIDQHLSAAIDRAENQGEKLISHAFWQVLLLIVIWAGVYVGAKLLLHRYTARTDRA